MITMERNHEVAFRIGKVSGAGHSDTVGTNLRPLHHGHDLADTLPGIKALLTTPAVVKVASKSAADTSVETGARTVLLSGLDENGDEQTETVTLNGTTAVTTVNLWKIVTEVKVTSAGSGGVNAGILWVGTGVFTTGTPAVALLATDAGVNISAFACIAVPNNKRLTIDQVAIFEGDTSKTINFQFYQYDPDTGLWYEVFDILGSKNDIILPITAKKTLVAGSVIMIRAAVNQGTAQVAGFLSGWLHI